LPAFFLSLGSGFRSPPMMYDDQGGKSFQNIILFAWHLQQSHKSRSSLISVSLKPCFLHPNFGTRRLRQSLTNSIIFPITKGDFGGWVLGWVFVGRLRLVFVWRKRPKLIDADLSVRRPQRKSLAKFNFAQKKNHTKSTPAEAPENNQNKIWIFLCSTHPKANRVIREVRWEEGPVRGVYQSAICLAGCGIVMG